MANNRLYLYNKETKQAIMLCKTLGSGPYKEPKRESLMAFFNHGINNSELGPDILNQYICFDEDSIEYDKYINNSNQNWIQKEPHNVSHFTKL